MAREKDLTVVIFRLKVEADVLLKQILVRTMILKLGNIWYPQVHIQGQL